MNILITGATGFIGSAIAKTLWAQGHHIVACVRQSNERLHDLPYACIRCDFMQDTDTSVWESRLDNIDLVINAVGIIQETQGLTFQRLHADAPIALFSACQKRQIRVIQISGLGADKPNAPFEFLSSKTQADNFAWSHCDQAVILYPSIVIGRGGDSTELFSMLAALPIIPLVGTGEQPLNPIYIDDVCAVVLNLINHWPNENKKYFLSGPEVFSFKELLRLLRKNMQLKSTKFISIPMGCMRAGAWISERLHLSTLNTDSLKMFEWVGVESTNYVGVEIKPLSRRLASEPMSAAEIFHFKTKLVWQALWVSLAALWIFTGITSACLDQAGGYQLLAQANIHGSLASFLICAGACLDIILGVLILCHWRWVYLAQLAVMLTYLFIISILIPQEWLHPLGAVTKNIPLMLVTLLMHLRSRCC